MAQQYAPLPADYNFEKDFLGGSGDGGGGGNIGNGGNGAAQKTGNYQELPKDYNFAQDFGTPNLPSLGSDVAKGAASGVAEGAVGMLGAIGSAGQAWDNATTWLLAHGAEKVGALPKGVTAEQFLQDLRDNPGASEAEKKGYVNRIFGVPFITSEGALYIAKDKLGMPTYEPETAAGRVAKGVTEFAPQVAFNPGTAAERVVGTLGAGLTSSVAGEALRGTDYEAPARFAGALIGGVGGAGAAKIGEMATDAARSYAKPFAGKLAPVLDASGNPILNWKGEPIMAKPGQMQMAGEKLLAAAENPDNLRATVANPPDQIVPGSAPTLFEQDGDTGLGQLQRRAETMNPAPFIALKGKQNAARVAELKGIAPEGAHPEDLPAFLRARLNEFDETSQDFVNSAQQRAAQRVSDLGGVIPPDEAGQTARVSLDDAKQTMRKQKNALYDAIDPEGKLNIVATPVQSAAHEIVGALDPLAKRLADEEKEIFDTAQSLPKVIPFNSLTAFDQRITAAMKEELSSPKGETPTYGRLKLLKSSVLDAINNGVENQIAHEAEQVQAGALPASQTLESRLIEERRRYYESRTGANSEQTLAGNAGAGSSAVPGVYHGTGTEGAGLSDAPGNPGIPETNFDEAAAARLNAAKAIAAKYAQTFKQGRVGDVLRTNGFQGQYRTPNATVVNEFFPGGETGFEAASEFRNAVNDAPKAVSTMRNYVTWSMLNAARNAEGVIDPARFNAWLKTHQSALRAFPELVPQFQDAATATQTMERFRAMSRDAAKGYQKGAIGQLLGVSAPSDVVKTVGTIFSAKNPVAQFQQLARTARKDPDAWQGLRKAVADHITENFISPVERGTSEEGTIASANFTKFLDKNQPALAVMFTPAEIASLQRVAADLRGSTRSVSGTALPGRATTAQDILPTIAQQNKSFFGKLASLGTATSAGYIAGGPKGAALGAASGLSNMIVGAMKEAGLQNVNDLVSEALLNPELAAEMLKRVPVKPNTGADVSLAKTLRNYAVYSTAGETLQPDNRQHRASGGRTGINHAEHALRLVRQADRAKKHQSRHTEPLLAVPDETIARALSVANQSI